MTPALAFIVTGLWLVCVGLAGLGWLLMRTIWGGIGAALGVVLGTCYAGIMWLVNRRGETFFYQAKSETEPLKAVLITRARLVPVGAAAITFGKRIYCRPRFPTSTLVRHELVHVAQYRRYGFIGFLARYGRDIALHGYDDSELEREARGAGH